MTIHVTCPCCGGHLGELPAPERVRANLKGQEAHVFDLLVKAGDTGLDRETISIELFGAKRGIKEISISNVGKIVSRLRASISRYGYYVTRNQPSKRGFYRIIPLEAGA